MQEKDLLLLTHFRKNAREQLTKISKRTNIPVSTIFDKLKNYENKVINKHTCLLNFKGLGYDVRAHLLFKVEKERRVENLNFLTKHESTNNIYRINNGYDYLVEAVFENLSALQDFYDEAEEYGIRQRQEHFVLEDLQRETFLNGKIEDKLRMMQ